MLILATLALAATTDRVTLSDGQVLEGEVQYLEEGRYRLFLKDGKVLDLPAGLVKAVQYEGEVEEDLPPVYEVVRPRPVVNVGGFDLRRDMDDDPMASHYLLGRSAYANGHLSGFVAQEELVLTSVGIGLSDYVDITASSILPLMVNEYSQVWCLDAKVSVPLGERGRAAVGVHKLAVSEEAATGFYGKVALGRRDSHLGLGGGALVDDATAVTNAFVNVEGITRIGPGVAFLGESWLVFRDASAGGADVVFVPGVAMRFYTRRVAIDAGLVPFDSAVFTGSMAIVPVPMFSVAYAWRGPR